jgi:hypothetical protein
MSEFINLQIYGTPVIAYGLVGLTTAVLAYTTYMSSVVKKEGSGAELPFSGIMPTLPTTLPTLPTTLPTTSPTPETTPLEEMKLGGKRHKRKTPKTQGSGSKKTQKHKKRN